MNLFIYKLLHPEYNGRRLVLQERNSIFKRCLVVFLILFLPMSLIFIVPIYTTLVKVGSTGDFWSLTQNLISDIFLFSFCIALFVFIVSIYYNCNDCIEFDEHTGYLYVNGIEHKIFKTEIVSIFKGRYEYGNTFYSGIYKIRLQHGNSVHLLSILPPLENYPESFNISQAEIKKSVFKSTLLLIVIGIFLLLISIYLYCNI